MVVTGKLSLVFSLDVDDSEDNLVRECENDQRDRRKV